MADLHSRPSRGTSRALWILVLVLLTPAVVVPLLVPLYDQLDPTLFGFPFFFWFQFALIPVAATFTTLAYRVIVKVEGNPDEVAARAERTSRWNDERDGGRP
jgi:uncharacterized membrane protein YhdT